MRKNSLMMLSLVLGMSLLFTNCKKKEDDGLEGSPGNPRFNLQFSNGESVDLDLHVQTPNGTEVYYGNTVGQGGELDVDCICGSCGSTGNENIFWTDGTAPGGTYRAWVEYYDDCAGSNASSTYTLRVLQNSTVVATYTGTLSPSSFSSPVYTFTK